MNVPRMPANSCRPPTLAKFLTPWQELKSKSYNTLVSTLAKSLKVRPLRSNMGHDQEFVSFTPPGNPLNEFRWPCYPGVVILEPGPEIDVYLDANVSMER